MSLLVITMPCGGSSAAAPCSQPPGRISRRAPLLGLVLVALAVVAAPVHAAITYVGRVASTTVATTTTSTTLTASRSVTAGDGIVVAVLLSSTSTTGTVKVADSAGNTYALNRDQNDGSAGDRTLVFSATNAKSLPSGGTITITYPSSAECHASADEFTGIAALERAASAFATGTSFNSGASGTTSQGSELIVGVVGDESGSSLTFAAGWTALPTLAISTDRLAVAYQIASSTGSFTASGTTGGTWMAAVLAFPGSGPPPDLPPIGALSVALAASPAFTVTASGAGSTDTDLTPIASYSFDFGDGTPAVVTTAPTSSATHTYAAAGTYTVTLTVTDTGGLKSTPVTSSITVDIPPVAALSVTPAASPPLTVTASGAGSTDTGLTPIGTYSFNFGDGTPAVVVTAPSASTTHTYAAAGTYTVTLVVSSTSGVKSAPVTSSVTLDVPPVAALSVNLAASPPLTVTASGANSTDPGLTPIASYSFNFGDGTPAVVTTAPTSSTTHTYAAAGTYTVTLTVTSTGSLTSAPATSSITVDIPPVAALSVTPAASPPLTVTASGAGSTDAGLTPIGTYSFNFGDGTPAVVVTAPTSSATHTYAAAGTYTVTLTVTSTSGVKSAPATSSVTVDVPPVAALSVTPAASPPLTVTASGAGSTDPGLTPIGTYSFNFGDGTPAVVTTAPTSSTTHTYAAAGTYTVTLTVTSTGGLKSAPVTSSVTVDVAPVAALSVAQVGTPQFTVNASGANSTDAGLTPIASYSFTFGDGTPAVVTTAPTSSTTHTYAAAGTYAVTLTVTSTGGLKSAPVTSSVTVTTDQPPVAALSVTQASSPPLTATASGAGSTDTDATPIASYSFDFGDGSPAVVTNAPTSSATHTYAAAGTYTVTLIVTDTANLASAPVTAKVSVKASLEKTVAASSDDARESSTGSVSLTGTSLSLGAQIVGLRWQGLTIPPGATVTAAWVQFTAAGAQSATTTLTLAGQAADNAPAFSKTTFNISSRPRTVATATWTPAAWATIGQAGTDQRTPDLSAVIQEVVSRAGWASGNALAIIVTGTGQRTAYSFDGNSAAAALLHVEYTTGTPPPDQPPVAKLSVSQAASPPLTVNASGSGSTDTDSTPIASYSFSFGDGTAAVVTTAPTSSTTHTYAAAGTYTVTLVVTDTGGLKSTPVTASVTVSAADQPPVAKLSVSQAASPALTVNASGSGSTDTDSTPIASYSFDFGDGTAAVVTTAPASSTTHTYAAAGTYTVTLVATDTGGLKSTAVTASVTVTAASTSSTAVYVGYYDTHHATNPQPKPNPWQGSPNVVFIGTSDHNDNNWDTSCIRVDNLSSGSLSGVVVTADLGSNHFALWGTNTIPAGYKLILAQTAYQNFDGSDTNPAGCYGCDPNLCLTERSTDVPVVHVTVNSTTKDYFDTGQIMNTGGYDGAGCPYVGGPLPQTRYDESHNWVQVYTASGAAVVAAPSAVTTSPPVSLPHVLALAPPAPNPARGVLALRFSLPTEDPVWLGLYDVSGRLVRTYVNERMRAGDYDFRRDLSDVNPGVYFIRLTTPGATLHERVVIAP